MSDDAPRSGASFSSAFSIILSLARERIAELGCPPVGESPQAFVDRGGLSRLENQAAEAAIRRVREAAYPLIFKLFGSEMPGGNSAKLFWLGSVKIWLESKRRWDIDCDPRGMTRANRQGSARVLTGSGARRPKVGGGKPDGLVVKLLYCHEWPKTREPHAASRRRQAPHPVRR
jgi:hypothetical protein